MLSNVDQTTPFDVDGEATAWPAGTCPKTLTTAYANDLLIADTIGNSQINPITEGTGQTELWQTQPYGAGWQWWAGATKAATTAGSQTMSFTFNVNNSGCDEVMVALKAATVATSATSTQYFARVDNGSDNSYSFQNNTWTVYDKRGTRYLYGSSDSGRQYDTSTGTSTNTYKWYLQEVRDTNGNYIKYTYNRDSNELCPYQIVYTGNGANDGPAVISFATSTRPDTRISFAPGFKVTTGYRISEIDASFNSKLLRKYLLSYGAGINGNRSLLTSVQQQGYDDNNNLVSLPATSFTYASSTGQFYTRNGVTSAAFQVADTNGNGINDRNEFYYTGCVNGACTTGLHIYMDSTSYVDHYNDSQSPPGFWASSPGDNPNEHGTRYVDVNGDGKPDVVNGWKDNVTPAYSNYSVSLNTYATSTGTGWTSTTTTGSIPTFAINNNNSILTSGIFGDVNGDGLPDYSSSLPGYIGASTYLGNGSSWDGGTSGFFTPVKDFPVTSGTPYASQLIDINGDGLDDWVYSDGTKTYVALNTGTGWEAPESQWTIGTSTLYAAPGSNPTYYYDRGIRFFDINGDGLPDFVRWYHTDSYNYNFGYPDTEIGTTKVILLNTGNGWATSTTYSLPDYIAQGYVMGGYFQGTEVFNEYANWIANGQFAQDVITNVIYPKGGSASVVYAYSAQSGKNPELPISLLVASEIGLYDGMGRAATTTYQYAGGKMYLASGVRDKKFAGFAIATTTAPDSIIGTYYSQGVGTNTTLGEQSDGYAQVNQPFRKDTYDLSGNLIQTNFYRWDSFNRGNNAYFLNLGRQVEQDYATDRTHRDKATDDMYSTTTGDLLTQTDYGEVSGNSDGTFADIGTDKHTTSISYAASSGVNLSVPIEKTVLNSASSTVSDQKLYYDNLSFGQASLGNNTRQEDWIKGSTYASSTKTFNVYGLVATSTDRRSYATGYTYDAFNLYVATATNPLNQKTQCLYNYANGKAKQTTDPNNRITKNLYDGVGRLVEVDQSDVSTPSLLATSTTYQFTDNTTTPSIIHRADYLTATNTVDTYDYYDGLNRLIQERTPSQTAGTYAAIDRIYNSAGLLGSQSLPYFSSGSSFTNPSSMSVLYTNYTYDPLKRPFSTVNAVGTTTNAYAKWTTTTIDPNGNSKDYVLDAFGNLVNVIEHIGSLATTTYTYDAANNLATTTDSQGNVRAFSYDGLARRLTAQDLHAATHTPFGSWSYSYDDAGNMISQVDPKGSTTTRTYDALSRLLTESSAGTTQVTNTYDSCTNGIGYLCTASSTAVKTQNAYDILGRVAYATSTIAGTGYTTSSTYDRQGNPSTVTYPNGSQVLYTYNLAGQLSRVQNKPSGGSWADIVSSFAYAPHGQVATTTFGNGASTTRTFNPNALYRLAQLQTFGQGGTTIQNIGYTYDPVGNITQIANTANTNAYAVTNFSYDQLNRLTVASTTPVSAAQATTSIAILDPFPLALYQTPLETSDSRWYSVPAGGSNKLFLVLLTNGNATAPTATLNGASLTFVRINGTANEAYYYVGYLANPSSGVFSITWSPSTNSDYTLLTVANAAQTNPIDASNVTSAAPGTSKSTSVTTTQGNDLLLSFPDFGGIDPTSSFGTGETRIINAQSVQFGNATGAYKNAGSTAGTETMTTSINGSHYLDEPVVAIKQLAASTTLQAATSTPYQQSFSYDNLGNILSITYGATSSNTIPPTIIASSTDRAPGQSTSDSFSFNAGATSTNTLLLVAFEGPGGTPTSATYNGQSLTLFTWAGQSAYDAWGYVVNPSPGTHTFTINYPSQANPQYRVFVFNNVNQTTPYDAQGESTAYPTNTCPKTLTTTVANDLLFAATIGNSQINPITEGVGQTELWQTQPYGAGYQWWAGATKPAVAPGSQTMSFTFNTSSSGCDEVMVALEAATKAVLAATTTVYAYPQTGYMNPDAVGSIGNGVSTTTYSYDANGNLLQAGGWNYVWDYLNRMLASGYNNSTTTYAYDPAGSRVLQTSTTSTTYYPNKYFSMASTIVGSTTYATSTNYIWNGDTLLATIDQKLINGTATGTPVTRYIHPDHLGSTNAVTDQNGNLVQLMDYYPYGATRVSTSTFPTNEKRQYIGQYSDTSGLSYLNARYYSPTQGQFLSQDPVSWGDPKQQDLKNPQNLNSYSYAIDNPITSKDPSGLRVDLISRPVFDINGNFIGAHTFFLVNPDNPSEIHVNGVPSGMPTFTFSAFPSGNPLWGSTLTKTIGTFESGKDNAYVFGGAQSSTMLKSLLPRVKPIRNSSIT